MNNKTVSVLAERGEKLLVKVVTDREVNGKEIQTYRYELWRSQDKFHNNIREEYINGQQFIYVMTISGGDENNLIQQFHDDLLK